MKREFYKLDRILKENARFSIIVGPRGNGKSFALLEHSLKYFLKTGRKTIYLRRIEEELRGEKGGLFFKGLENQNVIEKVSGGKYDTYVYRGGWLYLAKWDKQLNKKIYNEKDLFMYTMAISAHNKTKGQNYDDVDIVIFDEFLTVDNHFANEQFAFQNTISTIVRERQNVKIFLVGNPVESHSPYFYLFDCLELYDNMKKGEIKTFYIDENKNHKVALEKCVENKLEFIKNSMQNMFKSRYTDMSVRGDVLLNDYPKLDEKDVSKDDIIETAYLLFDKNVININIVSKDDELFLYLNINEDYKNFTTEDHIYSLKMSTNVFRYLSLDDKSNKLTSLISYLYSNNKVFYDCDWTGNLVKNYNNKARDIKITRHY